MIVFARIHTADQTQMMHLLSRLRQQLTDMDAGHRCRNRKERSAGVCSGFGIPALQLTQPAVHVKNNDTLLFRS